MGVGIKKWIDNDTLCQWLLQLLSASQADLGKLGYKFQFITLAGFHTLNHSMFQLSHSYAQKGMTAYAELQAEEFAAEKQGYTATKHQREVGNSGSMTDLPHLADHVLLIFYPFLEK